MYDYGGNEYWGSSENGVTPAVRNLLVANAVIYMSMLFVNLVFGARYTALSYDQMERAIGFVPKYALEDGWIWQFVTYAFVHAKGPMHILLNMFVLWMFGSDVERRLGRREFMSFYLAAALFGVLFHLPWAYITSTPATAVVGASGAVLATLVLFAALYPDRKVYFLIFGPFSARVLAFVVVAIDFAYMLGSSDNSVAYSVHVGGALFGFLYYKLRNNVAEYYEALERRWEEEERTAKRNLKIDVDNVLRKINTDGIESLTREERALLNRASKEYRQNND